MSFSSEVKENLSKISNFNNDLLISEFIGYIFSGNMIENEEYYEFVTENEFNIEHLYKILFNLKIEYEPEVKGKCFIAQIHKKDVEKLISEYENVKKQNQKNIVKGAFLGSGSVNNPEKNYHLEIIFNNEKYCNDILEICNKNGINFKKLKTNEKYQLYLKEAEEISKFLAFIGASKAVLKFEDVRVIKDIKNNVNRRVNCETANLNKTIDAAIRQIEDIKLIKKNKKYDELSAQLKQLAELRLTNPELSLKDLSELMEPKLSKSAINRKFQKIHEIAENLM